MIFYIRQKSGVICVLGNSWFCSRWYWRSTYVTCPLQPQNVKTDIELLWTNASHTSSFVKQTINLDLSKYRFVLTVFKRSSDSLKYVTCIAHIGASYVALFIEGNPQTRSYIPTTNGISFEEGLTWSSFTSMTIDNSLMIPYQIYGIK